jgi:bacterial/archaeal transporter family-2 protein
MDATTLKYAAVMMAAGIGIPVLAALNAQLGGRLGNPVAAAFCLFVVALLGTSVVLAVTGFSALSGVLAAPKFLFLAGLLIAFYVLTITWIAPKFGVGNAVFFVLLGQLISAAAIDHFGLMRALPQPITLTRAAGIATMAVGVFVTLKG